jgi:hypothetical protein
MSARLGWMIAAFLACSCVGQIYLLSRQGSGFETLPILVPVSLEHERAGLAGQSSNSKAGEAVLPLATALLQQNLDATLRVQLLPQLERLGQTRVRMLELRNRRHTLNIALMDVGVAIAKELSPSQWQQVHMQRDALRGRAEAEVLERVLNRLKAP